MEQASATLNIWTSAVLLQWSTLILENTGLWKRILQRRSHFSFSQLLILKNSLYLVTFFLSLSPHMHTHTYMFKYTGFLEWRKNLFCFRAASMAYGVSQARSLIGAVADGLYHNQSNARAEPGLWPTPHLMAMPDPWSTDQGQGSTP